MGRGMSKMDAIWAVTCWTETGENQILTFHSIEVERGRRSEKDVVRNVSNGGQHCRSRLRYLSGPKPKPEAKKLLFQASTSTNYNNKSYSVDFTNLNAITISYQYTGYEVTQTFPPYNRIIKNIL